MQRRGMFAGVAVLVALALSGCAEKDSDDGGTTPTETTSSPTDGKPSGDASYDVWIEFNGDDVTPNGSQLKVKVSEPITLHITADEPGELHVHTMPEQEIEYPAGESTHELTLDRAGVYEVESHDLEKIVVELEAS